MENWVCDFYLTYNNILKNVFLISENGSATIVQIEGNFSERSLGLAAVVHLHLKQKLKIFS